MSEKPTTATIEHYNGHDGLIDEDDFLEDAAQDADELSDVPRKWFPTEYVVAIVGPAGSGKSLLLAHYTINAVRAGATVFTNLELYPDKLRTRNRPRELDLNLMLSFDSSLTRAVISIEELDTWVERKRAMQTSNILMEKFLRQLRKRGLRVFFTQQSDFFPGPVAEQVDLITYCQDMYFTPWGMDTEIPKGTTFHYTVVDHSGKFTGYRGSRWDFGLRKGNRMWDKYDSYKIYDPMQWAVKTRVVGQERTYDLDEHRLYSPGELEQEMYERDNEKFIALQGIYQSWGNDLTKFAQASQAATEFPAYWEILSYKMEKKVLPKLEGKEKEEGQALWSSLLQLIRETNGEYARYAKGGRVIILDKPIIRTPYGQPVQPINAFKEGG